MRMDELTEDMKKLKRYFLSDDVLSVEYNEELGVMQVAMSEKGFLNKFNCYEEESKNFGIKARHIYNDVLFEALIVKRED